VHYDKALALKPSINWIYGDYLHILMMICDWDNHQDFINKLINSIKLGKRIIKPFPLLSLLDDPMLILENSKIYVNYSYPANQQPESFNWHLKNNRIKIAYFSGDFNIHPVAYLIAELFELHNKEHFETYAFSFINSPDEMNHRIRSSFEHYINVESLSDLEVASLARDLNIDIAIDLSGFTKHCRTGIFANRAAPIQVNYLGYPGTMGANYYDYIIADHILIPEELRTYYSEKIVYLPNSYQPNDRKRTASNKVFSRRELGLPEQGFVYSCFNNSFKILPTLFLSWMRILAQVDDSVLWLLLDNHQAATNLKKEAEKHGIDSRRIIFSDRVPHADHLARQCVANLFLDTFPYNAHTTASDALWSGLPVLTRAGQTFSSRVAASLLNAVDLSELITSTEFEYEAIAIDLAKNSDKYLKLRAKTEILKNKPLFNSVNYTKNIELAYFKMYKNFLNGNTSENIFISECGIQ
jgi:predicted O-linked N-acetylglucosamine transferase (SPINDLY family)